MQSTRMTWARVHANDLFSITWATAYIIFATIFKTIDHIRTTIMFTFSSKIYIAEQFLINKQSNEAKNDPTYGQFSSTLAKVLTSSILNAKTAIKRRKYFNIIFNVRIELCYFKENVGKTIWFILNTVFRILYLQYNFASIDVMSWSTLGGPVQNASPYNV